MLHYPKRACLALAFLLVAKFASAADAVSVTPWQTSSLGIETGVLWEIGSGTPFPYRLLHTQFSYRSREFLGWELNGGSRIAVRHRLTLQADAVQQGPESHYVSFSGSPSLEWWDKSGRTSLYTGAGGGLGAIDSRGIKGGMGQDLTLNWFIRGGLEHVTAKNLRLNAGIMYQHMSNGGMTKPNPGIDALGFMIGCSWTR